MASKQHPIKIQATPRRRIDVDTALFRRHLPAGVVNFRGFFLVW